PVHLSWSPSGHGLRLGVCSQSRFLVFRRNSACLAADLVGASLFETMFMQRVLSRRLRAFTLVELLVAVLLIGILAAIAIPTFLGQRNRAYDTEAISALKNTQTAIMTVLAGELEMPRPVEALVAALEEIEPVYTFVAVNPANAAGYDADGPEHVGSR